MSMKSDKKTSRKFLRDFDRAAIRSAYASMFAAIINAKKREGGFTYSALAGRLGVGKSVVSRWFNRDVNWELNTIADIAAALDIDLRITAIDRQTGKIFGPAGQISASVSTFSHGDQQGTSERPATSAISDGSAKTSVVITA